MAAPVIATTVPMTALKINVGRVKDFIPFLRFDH
jgi:hypothetical protein